MVVPKELDDVIKKFNKINPIDFMLFLLTETLLKVVK
jgi:hypothetical protein